MTLDRQRMPPEMNKHEDIATALKICLSELTRRRRRDQRARAHSGNRGHRLADYLLKQPHGGEAIRTMITDDIHAALCSGRVKHAQELFMALRHFLDEHPEARAGVEA